MKVHAMKSHNMLWWTVQCWADHGNSQQKLTCFERMTADCSRSLDRRRRSWFDRVNRRYWYHSTWPL